MRKYSAPSFLSRYRCPLCCNEWEDLWSCPASDQCEKCELIVTPYQSDDMTTKAGETV